MEIYSLAGAWEFRQQGTQEWMPASVPGGVHTDLITLGRIADPFVSDNEKRFKWVAEADWEYRRSFRCSDEILAQDKILLVCDGLDTLATVMINGTRLGQTDNMFRQYRWEVKELLFSGENELHILFESPVRCAGQLQANRILPGVPQAIPGGPHLRKAPCQFGWDWGPQLPPIGTWKDIRLEGYNQARLSEVHLRQQHSGGQVELLVKARLERWGLSPLSLAVHMSSPAGEKFDETQAVGASGEVLLQIPIHNPQLWWPNGYGEQPLYQVEVILLDGNSINSEPLDRQHYQVGLRSIELSQQADQWGHSFVFVVNNVLIFAKGANWIPADSFPTRISEDSLEGLIRSAVATHQNMLRVWGGGFYEDEHFYDLCDRYGILVWQEFIFSCSIYPLDDPVFLENVLQEVIDNVRRLRHRACLAVWCGNNEMEWGWVDWGWNNPELQGLKAAYDQFFHHTLPSWCLAEDPDHAYWPSSPSSNIPFDNPNSQNQGDCHYWDVWHGRKPFSAYRSQYPRFMSEFGFQALPPLATIRTYADEADWNMTSYIMEQHQKNASGNSLMVGQMLDTFRLPKDFASLVYLSMVLQAEGIRYGVEHWRRHPERVAGTLYWQLNDCWPVASWSSLDYFGRWKALHYTARRFYAPLLLTIEDNPPEMGVYITNDTLESWAGSVEWRLETLDGQQLAAGKADANVAAQSASQVCKEDFSDYLSEDNLRQTVFVASMLSEGGSLIGLQVAFFAPIKHLTLADPHITSKISAGERQLNIDLASDSLALLVELKLGEEDVVFSDNYFNLPARQSMRVTCPLLDGWTEERVKRELNIRSVYDSYAHPARNK
jgi:beta-mannosidase